MLLPLKSLGPWLFMLSSGGFYLLGLVVGATIVIAVGNKYPRTWARHDGACGMGDYWSLVDWVVTYLIMGLIIFVILLVKALRG